MRVLIIALFLAAATMSAQQPTFATITDKIDWGTLGVPEVGYLEGNMYITNTSKTGIVKIVEVRPGCGCTKVEQDKDELKPGEKATVKVRLNISPMQAGSVVKSIAVRTALGTDTTMTSVMLSANIERLLTFGQGMYFPFGEVALGTTSEKQITMENHGTVPVTITNIKMDGPFTVNLKENTVIAPGTKVVVVATVEGSQPKQLNGAVSFTAKGLKEEKFTLSGYGSIVAPPTTPVVSTPIHSPK